MKDSMEEKPPVLSQRNLNKVSASGDFGEGKLSKLLRGYETKRDKTAEDENKSLQLEIQKLQDKLKNFEEEKKALKRELNKATNFLSGDVSNRVSVLEDEKNELSRSNITLKLEVGKLGEELSHLAEERSDFKRKYEDLKSCYDALETLTSNKFSECSMGSMAMSDADGSPFHAFKPGKNCLQEESSRDNILSSIQTNSELSEFSLNDCRKLISEVKKNS